jgi:GTP-binding protein
MRFDVQHLRNVAIIAHVDHGKTTLVDGLLKQAGTFRSNEAVADRVMDSGDLEKERGITITAKNTAVILNEYKINIVDTPGHADFGGEVERILAMVDGACLLVDAAEGPLPQTRFVLRKALAQGLKVMVVINKVDRPDARPQAVLDEVFNLFIDLEANDEQADFPVIYAIARDGKAAERLEDVEHSKDLMPLFKKIIEFVPAPKVDQSAKTKMLISNLGYSDYLGRLAIGRVSSGNLKVGSQAAVIGLNAKGENTVKQMKITGLFTYHGLRQAPAEEVTGGDIAVLSGIDEISLGDSVVEVADPQVVPLAERWDPISLVMVRPKIDEPTLAMEWAVNNSPMAGREGEHVTSRKLRDRLIRETMTNVALRFMETESPDRFIVMGRGEFQMAILAEQMRREGFEFALGQPRILNKEIDGVTHEPMELAVLDVPEFSQGTITQMFQIRKGLLQNIVNRGGRVRLEILIPSRGLIGLRSRFMTETRGEGLFNFISAGFEPLRGDIPHRLVGCLVSDRAGDANSYSLESLQDRGVMFIGHGAQVYEGMVLGENARPGDLWINVTKAKQLTNFRTVNKDDAIVLTPPRVVTLERGIEWITEEEILEVTPKNIRARKKILAKNQQPK